jgi:hypothetical protein
MLNSCPLQRLKEIYKEHGHIVVAFDFDETIFPYSGKFKTDQVMDLALRCQSSKKCSMILYTCREDEKLEAAIKYCDEKGLYFHAVNESLTPGFNCRKPFYNILLDDKAGLPYTYDILTRFLDWIDDGEKA